jgi:hypothetical protein
MSSSGPPTGRLVAIVVGVILAVGVLTVAGLVVAGYVFASRVDVRTTRDADGREKTFRVDTPLGRLRVDKAGDLDPKLLEIPVYPGAVVRSQDSGARVDLDLDFADQRLRVLAVEMETTDPVEQVIDYYREAAADFVFSRKRNDRVEFRWESGNLRKVVGIVEKDGKTRISLANVGEPEAN